MTTKTVELTALDEVLILEGLRVYLDITRKARDVSYNNSDGNAVSKLTTQITAIDNTVKKIEKTPASVVQVRNQIQSPERSTKNKPRR